MTGAQAGAKSGAWHVLISSPIEAPKVSGDTSGAWLILASTHDSRPRASGDTQQVQSQDVFYHLILWLAPEHLRGYLRRLRVASFFFLYFLFFIFILFNTIKYELTCVGLSHPRAIHTWIFNEYQAPDWKPDIAPDMCCVSRLSNSISWYVRPNFRGLTLHLTPLKQYTLLYVSFACILIFGIYFFYTLISIFNFNTWRRSLNLFALHALLKRKQKK